MESKLIFVDLEELTTPRNGQVVMTDRWWVVWPGRGAVFYRFGRTGISPQCNSSRVFVENLCKELYPDCVPVFIPVAYVDQCLSY